MKAKVRGQKYGRVWAPQATQLQLSTALPVAPVLTFQWHWYQDTGGPPTIITGR